MDPWSRWLLQERFGGNADAFDAMMASLVPVRDKLLDRADLRPSDVLLDVGTGDGLIGFGALDRLGDDGRVIFSDISDDLLESCRRAAADLGVLERCRFAAAAAEHLSGVLDSSVDVVTTRSVLIYVDDKLAAVREFQRVLRLGGRVSLFEPLNRLMRRLNATSLFGYDARPIRELADKLRTVYEHAADGTDAAMMGFDAVDLVANAEAAGLDEIDAQVNLTAVGAVPARWGVGDAAELPTKPEGAHGWRGHRRRPRQR